MPISLGNTACTNIKVGTSIISAIYKGTVLVWSFSPDRAVTDTIAAVSIADSVVVSFDSQVWVIGSDTIEGVIITDNITEVLII